MIGKSEYVNWANVWRILGADHLTFEGVMGDFRQKYPADWFRGGKACKYITGENNILHWKNIAHDVCKAEKNLTLLYVREKNSNSRELGKKFLPMSLLAIILYVYIF